MSIRTEGGKERVEERQGLRTQRALPQRPPGGGRVLVLGEPHPNLLHAGLDLRDQERPPLAARVDTAVRQFELAREDKGEHIACLEARKHFAWYLRGVAYANYYKEKISRIGTMDDVYAIAAGIKRDLR